LERVGHKVQVEEHSSEHHTGVALYHELVILSIFLPPLLKELHCLLVPIKLRYLRSMDELATS